MAGRVEVGYLTTKQAHVIKIMNKGIFNASERDWV